MMENVFFSKAFRIVIQLLATSISIVEVSAQSDKVPSDSITATNKIMAASLSPMETLYLVDVEGTITRYDVKLTGQKKPRVNLAGATSIDAKQLLKIFVFYGDRQQYQFLDRYLTPINIPQQLNKSSDSEYELASLSSDQMIWLADPVNLRLRKYNPILHELVVDTDLSYYLRGELNLRSLKEKSNLLFVQNKSTVLVFDNMGNYISKLPLEAESFDIRSNKLYYYKEGEIWLYDLEKLLTIRTGIKERDTIVDLLCSQDNLYVVLRDKVKIYNISER